MHPREQTIFALSSGRLPSAIALVRVSGPQAMTALTSLAGKLPMPRMATRVLLHDVSQRPIDDAVVLWFPGPASATGEDVAEFHVHGGRAVLAALFSALSAFENIRAAEPGEFTRRAFENGKLDLTEAEALDDLIHADTDRQRRQALRQMKGLLGDKARDWRAQIIEASALIEAVLAAQGQSERLRDGLVVAIAGPPNVGKSTLMNQLARREVAIVSPHAGTTRDVIEIQLDLDGYPVMVIDTAGIRETGDPVEQEGVRRARARAEEADLVLWMVDAQHAKARRDVPPGAWVVRNKIDIETGIAASPRESANGLRAADGRTEFGISAARGDGVQELIAAVVTFAQEFFGSAEGGLIGRERQRKLLQQTADLLRRSISVIDSGEELAAEELRRAAVTLGRLLGRVDVEDVLDVIFREFCIGK
jgi:tRNA modification GTPase